MHLYLMRHADALNVGEVGIRSDYDRTLSSQGKEQTRSTGQFLNQAGISIDIILSSPLPRAKETAAIIKSCLNNKHAIIETPHLSPIGSMKDLCQQIASLDDVESVLLVGHIPDLEHLTSYLLTGGHRLQSNFRKTSICCMDIQKFPPKGSGILRWMLSPDLLPIINNVTSPSP